MKPSYKQIFEKQKQYEDIVKKACPSIDNRSGVYFYTRTDLVTGEKLAYIGLARNLLARCCQHMLGYQHIDISIRKRGLYSKENEGGWKLNCLHFPEHLIEEKERFYIEQYQKANVTLLNIEGGGRQGKVDIAERKPAKTYTDGKKFGRKKLANELKHIIDNYLIISLKKETKTSKKALEKFYNLLDNNE